MATSLVRSRAAITGTKDRFTWNEVKDGAVLQEDGVIVAVGTYDDLHAKHPTVPVVGTGKEILLPGFVNGHHHVGLTPVQLGSPDMPLELWFITRMVIRNLDLYLDTLYSAFEMISSGITTVQHIQGWMPGTLPDVEKRATETIRAYEDIGMRVSYCYAVRDQNRLVYQADEEFVASLPAELQGPMQRWFDRFKMSLDDAMDMFKSFHSQHHNKRRVKIQLAPANLHWCSDGALTQALRRLGQVRRADAHASARDRLPEGICLAARQVHGAGVHRPLRHGEQAPDAGPRRVAEREGHRPAGRGGRLRLPQLLFQFPPALRRGRAQSLREEGHQHRDRARRGRHQRRPRHAAGAEAGAARPSRARHGRGRRADHVPGLAHGDGGWRQNDAVSATASARWKSARAPTWCCSTGTASPIPISTR